jgi:hypothetical protein
MKSVSCVFAFRKLNEWQEKESPLTFGPVGDMEGQEETITIFSGSSGTRVLSADVSSGIVILFGEGSIELAGASFKFSDFDDPPLIDDELGPDEYAEYLEATLPDGRTLLFARNWELR